MPGSAPPPPTSDVWRERVWMVRNFDGETIGGPLSLTEIREGMSRGKLEGAVLLAREGSTAWRPLDDVMEDASDMLPTVMNVDAPRIGVGPSRPPPPPPAPSVRPPPPALPQVSAWFVAVAPGQVVGPVTNDQVLQAIEGGQCPPESSVCVSGESVWKPISSIAAFAAAFERRNAGAAHGGRSGPISVAPGAAGTPEVRMSLKVFVILCAGGMLVFALVLVLVLVLR